MTTRPEPMHLVSAAVACDWLGIDRAALDSLVRRGAVHTERIRGVLYVDLDDAERAVKATREGGNA